MVGVDLSPKMADLAQRTGCYDEVKVEDIHDTIQAIPVGEVDLVLSADTFIYVGQLDRCFELIAAKLRPAGLFSFSVEELEEESSTPGEGEEETTTGFLLLKSGRYAHTQAYIQRLSQAHGMTEVVKTPITVRSEQSVPINGYVYVLEKS